MDENQEKRRPSRKASKHTPIIVCAIAAIAVACSALCLNSLIDQNETEQPAASIDSVFEYPTVQFAAYRQAEGIPLMLTATSVERDLSIFILDEDLQPVINVAFEVEAIGPNEDGGDEAETEPIVLKDEEGSGKIYVDDLEPGEYTLTLQQTGRYLSPDPLQVEVKAKIEHEVIKNISEKIVNAKNVNAAAEDAGYNNKNMQQNDPPPPPLTDTIPYYESKTITVQKEVTVPLLDENGIQIIKYKPTLESGFLKYKAEYLASLGSGAPDPLPGYTSALDSEGYLTSDYTATSADGPAINGLTALMDMFEIAEEAKFTVGTEPVTTYQGWQTLDGKQYYYNLNGVPVTGSQVIQGTSYVFDSNGVLQQNAAGKLTGVDISTYQSNINWSQARSSGGIHFAMIRAGYRGYGTGVLVEDDKFRIHAQGAQAAGVKVGIYYFSQAINEREAVEEASAAIAIAKKYGIGVSYPIAIDIEYSNSAHNGRADGLSGAQRTAVAAAFCETVRNAGYTPMIYASKSWFENGSFLNTSQLTQYKIWLAHWGVAQSSYKGRFDMWQYTSDGSVPGISGRVDMNISYLGY